MKVLEEKRQLDFRLADSADTPMAAERRRDESAERREDRLKRSTAHRTKRSERKKPPHKRRAPSRRK
jgi:hypothetical protein